MQIVKINNKTAKVNSSKNGVVNLSFLEKINGKTILTIKDFILEDLPEIIEEAHELWDKLVALFQTLPDEIVIEGFGTSKVFELVVKEEKGKGKDIVEYVQFVPLESPPANGLDLIEEGVYRTLFRQSAPREIGAKFKMKEFLMEKGLL